MKISIGSDHAGIKLKSYLVRHLKKQGHLIKDEGTYSEDSCDYPDFAVKVALSVKKHNCDRGILICGTGIGMSITANKLPGIRAALCHSVDTAALARAHNDTNVLCIGARVLSKIKARRIVDTWLGTDFSGDRHSRRIKKIEQLELRLYK